MVAIPMGNVNEPRWKAFVVLATFCSYSFVAILYFSQVVQASNAAFETDYNPSVLYVTSAIHWPTCKVGPYDWMYYPVEVPEGTAVLSIELKKIEWQDQADQAGPLLCIRKGGAPLPSDGESLEESIEEAASEAARKRPNENALGACSWFRDDITFNVTSEKELPGIWELGFFSVTNDSRTQSQMIPRGPVYHFEVHLTTYGCTGGGFIVGSHCQDHIIPLPPSFPPSSPPSQRPPPPTLSPPLPSEPPTPSLTPAPSYPPASQPAQAPLSFHHSASSPPSLSPVPLLSFSAKEVYETVSVLDNGLDSSRKSLLSFPSMEAHQTDGLDMSSEQFTRVTELGREQSSMGEGMGIEEFSTVSAGVDDTDEDIQWQYLKGQCYASGDLFKYFQIRIQGLAADFDVEVYKEGAESSRLGRDTLDGVSHDMTDVDPAEEDKGILHLRHGAIPTAKEDHFLPPIELPDQGLWYVGVPAYQQKVTRQRENLSLTVESGVRDEADMWTRCFTLRWRLKMCSFGQGGYECGWPVVNLERVIPERQYESSMDAIYVPSGTSNNDWFSLSLMPPLAAPSVGKPNVITERQRRSLVGEGSPLSVQAEGMDKGSAGLSRRETGHEDAAGSSGTLSMADLVGRQVGSPLPSEPYRNGKQSDTSGKPFEKPEVVRLAEDDEFWGYFSLVVPPGASGSILSITIKVGSRSNALRNTTSFLHSRHGDMVSGLQGGSPAQGPGLDEEVVVNASEESVFFEILGKLGGIPSDGDSDTRAPPTPLTRKYAQPSDLRVNLDGGMGSGHASSQSGSFSSGLLKVGKDGSLDADIIYPPSGMWYFGVRYIVATGMTADNWETITSAPAPDPTGENIPYLLADGTNSRRGFGLSPPRFSQGSRYTALESTVNARVHVSMHGCPDGCSGYGGCHSLLDASRLQSVMYCYCDRSHGGTNCSIELVSPKEASKHVLFLVSSNLAAILPSLWTIRHKAYPEWVIYTTSGVSSAVYHSCDTDSWCAASYGTLQFADFFLSFMAVVITFLFVAAPPPDAKLTCVICFTIVDAVIARDRATSGSNIYIVAFLGFVGLFVAWGLEFARERRLWHQRAREELFRRESWREYWADRRRWHDWFLHVIHFFKELGARYCWLYLAAGFVALGASKLNWWYETASTYWIWHSLWHLSIYTSAYFFLCATEPPKINSDLQPNSPDSSAGIEGVRLGTTDHLDSLDDDEEKALVHHFGEGSEGISSLLSKNR